MNFRIGQGYDIHKLAYGKRLVLGGVEIPFDMGCIAHSDGDTLCHAITDALLGAGGLGDIGKHFPDTDESLAGVSSLVIMAEAFAEVKKHLWRINNIDATIILERPKLAEYIPNMCEKIAGVLHISPDIINIKAKTAETLGAVGDGVAVEAHAVVLLVR
ncbi:MAG TPA: 2-C-methyl-D-erythritol 2,4-cyclodiphosphate synthase [candidate division Zixibacteria bacterium]|nr:2-C-methyl-D-erythritol 2,4-cyclodiphosphate synthase [candidate division Zixibacteria bacterium]